MLPIDTSTELAKRAIATIFISHGLATNIDNTDILSILAELLSLVILRTLRLASTKSTHANRTNMNIFDVLLTLASMKKTNISGLLRYFGAGHQQPQPQLQQQQIKGNPSKTKSLVVLPAGRSLIRALADEDDEDEDGNDHPSLGLSLSHPISPVGKNSGPRPVYITDIYPPFPRAYTFRQTETRGIRESDKVVIAKSKAEQQRLVESNLFRLLEKTGTLSSIVRYDEESFYPHSTTLPLPSS